MEPLTSALDAAVRLAADASVAAEALENLKRCWSASSGWRASCRISLPARTCLSFGRRASVRRPTCAAPLALPPLPLPLHAMPDAAREVGIRPCCSRRHRGRRRPPPERRVFDVRGFMAGFALSWAFGVVLYLFMTAG